MDMNFNEVIQRGLLVVRLCLNECWFRCGSPVVFKAGGLSSPYVILCEHGCPLTVGRSHLYIG